MIERLKQLGFKDMEFNLNCNNLSLGAIKDVSQAIIMINIKNVNLLRILFKRIHHSFKIYSVILFN